MPSHRPQEATLAEAHWQLASRAEFDRLLRTPPEGLTEIQRAARFYWLQRWCHGGKPVSRTFPTRPTQGKGITPDAMARHLRCTHARLAGVAIEQLDDAAFLRRYDGPGTLFYLDPPYFGCEDYHGKNLFGREQFEHLAELLAQLKGRFILSLNGRPEVRRIFARFAMEPVKLSYKLSGQVSAQKPIITDR